MNSKYIIIIAICLGITLSAQGAENEFWLNHPNTVLYPLKQRGLSERQIRKLAEAQGFVIAGRRKPPLATLTRPSGTRAGTADYRKIAVELLEEAGVARDADIRLGFPLPQGALYNAACIRVTDPQGGLCAAQTSPLAFWPDKSLKWVLIQFTAALQAWEKSNYFVEFGNRVSASPGRGISVSANARYIVIDNGRLKAEIDRKKFNIIRRLTLDGNEAGGFSNEGIRMTRADGEKFTLPVRAPRDIRLIEKGPERVSLRISGDYGTDTRAFMSYVARLTFRRNQPGFQLEYTHINSELLWEFSDLTSLVLGFRTAEELSNWKIYDDQGAAIEADRRVFQGTDRDIMVDGAPSRPGRIGGVIGFDAGKNKMAIALTDAWKRYPKAFSVGDDRQVNVELLPQQPDRNFNRDLPYYLVFPFCEGEYRMKWGMSFTEKIHFQLDKADPRAVAAEADKPVIAMLPGSWYAETKVYPGMLSELGAEIDAFNAAVVKERFKQAEKQREYGFFNYGDSFGERGRNWTNNEYDMAHGMFMLALRTGNRDYYRYALAAARHQADVDTAHAYPDPYYVGANLIHSCGHTGTTSKYWGRPYSIYSAATNGHTWVNGMIDAWQLRGDTMVMDAAYLTGDHLALAAIPNYKQWNQVREAGWMLHAICALAAATGDPAYRKAADKCAGFIMGKLDFSGEWWAGRKSPNPRGPVIGLFICGVLLNGMCDYYELTERRDMLKKINRMAAWMLESFSPGTGCGFFYDRALNNPVRFPISWLNMLISIPIIRAADLCGDNDLYRQGVLGAMALFHKPCGSYKGKDLAMFLTFLPEFYQSVKNWENGHPAEAKLRLAPCLWRERLVRLQDNSSFLKGSGRIKIRLKRAARGALSVRRMLWAAPDKAPEYAVALLNPKGETVKRDTFDPTRSESRFDFTMAGVAGEEFTLKIEDSKQSLWLAMPDQAFVMALRVPAAGIFLPQNELRKYYFEIPAGQAVEVSLQGDQRGPFGFAACEADGRMIGQRTETKSHTENPECKMTFPALPAPRVVSVITYARRDVILKIPGIEYISTSRNYFAAAEAEKLSSQ